MSINNDGLKVLLVDDTRIVLDHLSSLLSSLAHVSDTRAVLRAEDGLALLTSYEPDVIVLDINMPGMNGIEMLRSMNLLHAPRPVVIMLTNNTFAGYRDECMRLGADHFLDKSRDFQLIPEILAGVKSLCGM